MRPCGAAALHLTSANRRWHLQDPPRGCGQCGQYSFGQYSFAQHSLLANDFGDADDVDVDFDVDVGFDVGFAARLID